MFDSIKRIINLKSSDITMGRVFSALWRRIISIPDKVYFYQLWGFPAINRKRLKSLNNLYAGERCFVIANGPSLNKVDFNLLKEEYTFGMNRIYLMKAQNGFKPTFMASIDKERLIKPFHNDFDELDSICFFPFELRKYFSKKDNQYFLGSSFSPKFQTDASKPMGNGKTVTYDAIQLAFCMGFSEVYIIGKDHSFNTTGKVGTGVEVKEIDENHFIKNYLLPGQKFDIPDWQTEEYAYKLSRETFEKEGRVIKNATIGGKLEIFERVDFYSLFPRKQSKVTT